MAIGFDRYPANHQLILGIPMEEAILDALNHDRARPHHTMTPHATATNPVPTAVPLSNLNYLLFDNADNEYLDTPDVVDIRFGPALPFTLAVWVYPDQAGVVIGLFSKGVWGAASGWFFYVDNNAAISMVTDRAGPVQDFSDSANGEIVLNTWQFVAGTFDGAGNCLVFKNGIDVTDNNDGTHAPVADAVENLYVACMQNGTGPVVLDSYWSGGLWNPRIWSRALSQWDIEEIFQVERHLFGV